MKDTARAFYFDLDGTLLDVSRRFHRALNVAFASEGHPPLPWETFRERYGRDTLTDDLHPARVGPFWKTFLEDFSHNPAPHPGEPFPGVAEMLTALKARGYPLAVITNRACTSDLVKSELDRIALGEHFEVVLSQGDFNFRKGDWGADHSLYSKEAMIHDAGARLGVAPQNVVFVGDLVTDMVSAREAGCRHRVGVLTGGMHRAGLQQAGAVHILETAAELLSLL